jgi:hypothetical protein
MTFKAMTLKNIVTIFIGLMFCFCLLSKQSLQSYHVSLEMPSVHDVVAEEADVNDVLDASDQWMIFPVAVVLPVLFLIFPVFYSRYYSSPIISTPKRPPSF